MPIDWVPHYSAIYTILGEDALLTTRDASTVDVPVTIIDHTEGVAVGDMDRRFSSGGEITSILPVAYIRVSELSDHGLSREDIKGGTLDFNGSTWRIKATMPKPSGKGEPEGELQLILADQSPTA